jgi:hypothetical protein
MNILNNVKEERQKLHAIFQSFVYVHHQENSSDKTIIETIKNKSPI